MADLATDCFSIGPADAVTTVGYGDVTPKHGIGRFIGAVVMLRAVLEQQRQGRSPDGAR